MTIDPRALALQMWAMQTEAETGDDIWEAAFDGGGLPIDGLPGADQDADPYAGPGPRGPDGRPFGGVR